MQHAYRSNCGDPVFERSLLPPPAEAGESLPLAWIEALAHETEADIEVERPALVLMDSGSAQLDCGLGLRNRSFDLRAGSLGCFAAGSHLRASRWRWAPARRIAVDLAQAALLAPDLDPPLRHARTADDLQFGDDALAALVRGLAHEAACGQPHGPLFADSLLLGLLQRLQQRHSPGRGGVRERGRLSATQLQRLEDFVRQHLAQPLNLQALAQTVGFSPAQFVRLLKRCTGQTPHQYVLARRLERARALVLSSEHPLALIAQDTGFSSQSHLTSSFARAFGSPPGALRRAGRCAA